MTDTLASQQRSPRWLLPLLLLLFFGSGACALVYQVMWLRLLALVFGVTVYAAGAHSLTWDGRDTAGRAASAGVYQLRLSTPGAAQTGRWVRLD